jgi:hypothetical protein
VARPLERVASAAELRLQWIAALDAAASALEVAARARTLAPAVYAAEYRLLSCERAWLDSVLGRQAASRRR